MHCFASFSFSPLINTSSSEALRSDGSSSSNCSANSPCSTADFLASPHQARIPNRKIKNVRKSTNLRCVVCGDRPTGYHYDVLSCNGCKTFFRRTVIANRTFSCTRGGQCDCVKDFRCACRSCRYRKCVEAGMNPNGIQFPEGSSRIKEETESLPDDRRDTVEEPLCERLLHIEKCCDHLRVSNVPLQFHETVEDVLSKPSLVECCASYQRLDAFDDQQYPITKRWMIMDCLLSIEYAKSFETFNRLGRIDQMALIRHVAFVLTGLSQAYSSYEQNLDIITYPDGSCPLLEGPQRGITHLTVTDVALKDTYRRPIEPLKRIAITRREYVMLKAIMLFTPNYREMSPEAVEIVDCERATYCSALHRHLVKEYGDVEGPKKYAKILTVSEAFVRFSDNRREKINICGLMTPMTFSAIGQVVVLRRDIASFDALNVVFESQSSK